MEPLNEQEREREARRALANQEELVERIASEGLPTRLSWPIDDLDAPYEKVTWSVDDYPTGFLPKVSCTPRDSHGWYGRSRVARAQPGGRSRPERVRRD